MTEEKAFCPGCPRRGVFMALGKHKFTAVGDVVCELAGARPPRPKARPHGAPPKRPHGVPEGRPEGPRGEVWVIDSGTLLDPGAGLSQKSPRTGSAGVSIVLDNGAGAATETEQAVDIAGVCRSHGVARVRTVDPFAIGEIGDVLIEEADSAEASVLIAQAPCTMKYGVKRPSYWVDPDKCEGCEHCFKVECSAMRLVAIPGGGRRVEIDSADCAGCGICLQLCKHDAIVAPLTS